MEAIKFYESKHCTPKYISRGILVILDVQGYLGNFESLRGYLGYFGYLRVFW